MVSDRAYIVEKGRIRWHGGMDDLEADETAKQQYLVV
jgi:ABC-type branched-subunit amino acid transport system ATPase component